MVIGISYAACTQVALGSGTMRKTAAIMNPALAIAQTTVILGDDAQEAKTAIVDRDRDVSFLWCYFFFPFLAALFASLFISKGHLYVLASDEEVAVLNAIAEEKNKARLEKIKAKQQEKEAEQEARRKMVTELKEQRDKEASQKKIEDEERASGKGADNSIKEAPETNLTAKLRQGGSYLDGDDLADEEANKSSSRIVVKKKQADEKEVPLLEGMKDGADDSDGEIERRGSNATSMRTVDLGDLGDDDSIVVKREASANDRRT